MKVTGSRGAAPSGPTSGPKANAGQGFSVQSGATAAAGEATRTARAAGVSGVGSIDALLALQEADGPLERRRRAVKRGGRILDMLEQVKISLLDGEGGSASLERLARAVREERAGTGDDRLEGVLNEIETRAAVEMAKAEMSRLAA